MYKAYCIALYYLKQEVAYGNNRERKKTENAQP